MRGRQVKPSERVMDTAIWEATPEWNDRCWPQHYWQSWLWSFAGCRGIALGSCSGVVMPGKTWVLPQRARGPADVPQVLRWQANSLSFAALPDCAKTSSKLSDKVMRSVASGVKMYSVVRHTDDWQSKGWIVRLFSVTCVKIKPQCIDFCFSKWRYGARLMTKTPVRDQEHCLSKTSNVMWRRFYFSNKNLQPN